MFPCCVLLNLIVFAFDTAFIYKEKLFAEKDKHLNTKYFSSN